ncbi:MAG: hypothetical protein E7294_05105 [Lachnospiraceae bacterium]|nr:hypothetical protein [Lachnospiraceae bacterium]
METGVSIVRRYSSSNPMERISIICEHYENFSGIVDSFEIGVFHMISSEKAYNRQSRRADLGVRIQSGNGYSDRTGDQAVENVMIKDAMKECDFSGDLLKDTDDSEKHRRDILTIQMMREEFDVLEAHLKALKKKEYRIFYSYLTGEKEIADIADEEHMLCESARNKISKTKKQLTQEILPFFRESL